MLKVIVCENEISPVYEIWEVTEGEDYVYISEETRDRWERIAREFGSMQEEMRLIGGR